MAFLAFISLASGSDGLGEGSPVEAHALAHARKSPRANRSEALRIRERNISDLLDDSARMRPVCTDFTRGRLAASGWLRYTAYFGAPHKVGGGRR